MYLKMHAEIVIFFKKETNIRHRWGVITGTNDGHKN